MSFKFMIVDDSSIIRKMIRKTIGMTSIEVSEILEAENGKQALDLIEKNWVDLLFLDINMPIMNGVEFLEKLRSVPGLADLPVVVVSTEGSSDRIERLKALGIEAYLRKPITPEALAQVAGKILGGV